MRSHAAKMSKVKIIILFLFLSHTVQSSDLQYGDHFQGDIKLHPMQENIFLSKAQRTGRLSTGLTYNAFRWPKMDDGFVKVPVEISDSFGA